MWSLAAAVGAIVAVATAVVALPSPQRQRAGSDGVGNAMRMGINRHDLTAERARESDGDASAKTAITLVGGATAVVSTADCGLVAVGATGGPPIVVAEETWSAVLANGATLIGTALPSPTVNRLSASSVRCQWAVPAVGMALNVTVDWDTSPDTAFARKRVVLATATGAAMTADTLTPVANLTLGAPLGSAGGGAGSGTSTVFYPDAGGVFVRAAPSVTPANPVVPTETASDWQCNGLPPGPTALCVL